MSEVFGAHIAPGQRYELDVGIDGGELRDAAGHLAAQFATSPGGEVATADGRWRSAVERQRLGWVIVLRDLRIQEPVACAYPRGAFNRYDLWIAPDDTYRLRGNPLSDTWTLRRDRTKLARLEGGASGRTVTTFDALIPDAQLGLVIVFACETLRFDDLIPHVGGGGGGG